VYLDGNSLGMPPKRTIERIREVFEHEWASGLIRSWDHWVNLPQEVGDVLAPLIGVSAGEVVVHDTTTLNVYQAVHAAIGLRPDRSVIAISEHDFPTDRYVVDGIAAATGHTVRHGFDRLNDVAVAVRSVWDLSHAAGAIEIDLHACGVQLAVGCSYKFLNGGPGAPAWTYVARELQAQVRQPIWGWFATRDMFAMGPTFEPRPDMARFLLGTPTILALEAARVGFELSAEAGMAAIHAKGKALTSLAIELCDQWGMPTPTPRDANRRGLHVAVEHPRAKEVVRELHDRNIIFDFREPNIIRAGCSPLTTRFVDIYDGLSPISKMR
jgi:kynureninase